MSRSELFERVIREGSGIYSSQLFNQVLREGISGVSGVTGDGSKVNPVSKTGGSNLNLQNQSQSQNTEIKNESNKKEDNNEQEPENIPSEIIKDPKLGRYIDIDG